MMMMVVVGWSVRMLTRGQSYEVEAGASIELECQFYADSFNLFDYPVVWHKRQRHWPHQQHVIGVHQQQQHAWSTDDSEPVEHCQVNMMGNVLEPFASVDRYRATFIARSPKYLFGLSLSGRRHDMLFSISSQPDTETSTVICVCVCVCVCVYVLCCTSSSQLNKV